MSEYSIDQILNFLSVVNHGSFSAAARANGCALPAVTYAVRKLEEQVGAQLFDRSDYRPALTAAGYALLPSARRLAEEFGYFRAQARQIMGGTAIALSIAVDRYFPMAVLADAMAGVQQRYPSVDVNVRGEALDGVVRLVTEQGCDLGILPMCVDRSPQLNWAPLFTQDFVMAVRSDHPLASIDGAIGNDILSQHVQLLIADQFDIIRVRDYFIHSRKTWKFDSLGGMMAVLRKGLGFAIIPTHLVDAEIQAGSLVSLMVEDWNAHPAFQFQFCVCWHDDRPLGPTALWLINHLQDNPFGKSGMLRFEPEGAGAGKPDAERARS